MSTDKPTCPQCGKDWVQKVSGLVATGITTGTGTANVNGKSVNVKTTEQTELSKTLAHPSSTVLESREGLLAMSVVCFLIGIALLVGLSEATRVCSWIFVAPGVAFLLLSMVGFAMSRVARYTWSEASIRDQNASRKWQQLFYCHTCDGVFIPGQTLFVPRGKMRDFCYDEYPGESKLPSSNGFG